MVYISAHFQSNVPSMAAWLFVPEVVNHPGRTLYLMTVIESRASSARGVREQERKASNVLFPKDHSKIAHMEPILPDPWNRNFSLWTSVQIYKIECNRMCRSDQKKCYLKLKRSQKDGWLL